MQRFSWIRQLLVRATWLPWLLMDQFVNAEDPADTTSDAAQISTVGGQAVLEGVMMRSPNGFATAVRRASGQIVVKIQPYVALAKRYRVYGLPVMRGMAALWESMLIGTRTLNWSGLMAQQDEPDYKPDDSFWQKALNVVIMIGSFIFAFGLFVYVPYLLSSIIREDANPVVFHIIAGVVRISLLLLYLWALSLAKDFQRLFMYHGAEHKSIYTFEEKLELNVDNAARQTRFHPRCGTSFILIVAVLTMIAFMGIDTILISLFGDFPNVFVRFLVHIPFIPLVAGVAFEFLKASDRIRDRKLGKMITQPGLWLQRITTREPDEDMLQVALVALRSSISLQVDESEARLAEDTL